MRKGFDGLMGLVQAVLHKDPFSGHLFVFRNKRSDRIKILVWGQGGFWLHYTRLEKGRFRFPDSSAPVARIEATELAALLGGIDLRGVRRQPRWQPSPPASDPPPSPAASSQIGKVV